MISLDDLGALGLVVVVLAAYRLTRIVTTDSISERPRELLYAWAWVEPDEQIAYASSWLRWREGQSMATVDEHPPLPRRGGLRTYVNELFQCPWCLGVWISAAVFALWQWVDVDVVQVVLIMLAIAGAQGWLQSREG